MPRLRACRTRLADSRRTDPLRHQLSKWAIGQISLCPMHEGHFWDFYRVLASAVTLVVPPSVRPIQEGVREVRERCGGDKIREAFAVWGPSFTRIHST